MQIIKNLKYWFITVCRGYSIPMSFLNWLVVFILALGLQGNIIYGILALIAIVFAHMGTNLLDDCVDYYLKSPKQECKTEYLETGFVSIKFVMIMTVFYFFITLFIGGFFLLKYGLPVLLISLFAGVIIISYPRLNHYALGELAVGLTFGILLFAGVSLVMTGILSRSILLISLPVSLLTVAVVYTHALMDYDFDIKSGKKTLCIVLGSKENGLIGLMAIYILTFLLTAYLIREHILPVCVLSVLTLIPLVFQLKRNLGTYIKEDTHGKDDFIKNFLIARNISLFYNFFIILCVGLSY